ncbi:MAG: hypothetical protein H6907_15095 [Hyphomicrobiales bacterium]|nr:hypothetical protein [Hyphomicrobiales bacterium]MCP5373051.1 hypothetical protein [Hyphomicrobiales bacterium]
MAVIIAVVWLEMAALQVFGAGVSGNDESSHVLNGYLIWSYLTGPLGSNPMAYAQDFYVHYPKISIGHWPPLYYAVMSLFFFISPDSFAPLMAYHLVMTALPALIVLFVLWRQIGPRWALAAGVVCALLPLSIDNAYYFMLDQTIAALAMAGMVLWVGYCRTRRLWYVLGYALVAVAAVMVKGNGWLMGLFPVFHIALARQWRLLLEWRLYVAAVVAVALVIPWYALTYKIASDGFNYQWGMAYFAEAFPRFAKYVIGGSGLVVVALAAVGAVLALANRLEPRLGLMGTAAVAMVGAAVLFHAVVPVAIVPRYVSAALPAMAVLAVYGSQWLADRALARLDGGRAGAATLAVVAAATVAMVLPGLLHLHRHPPKVDLEMDLAAQRIVAETPASTIVIDAHPGGEGALAYEVAIRDTGRRHYVVRSSDLLAQSNFMGSSYQLTVKTPDEVLAKVEGLAATWVVAASGTAVFPRFEHSLLIAQALALPQSPYELVATFPHRNRQGSTRLYRLREPRAPDVKAVRAVNYPEKAIH